MSHVANRKVKIPAYLLRKVSVLAPADPRSIRKVLRGEAVSPMVQERIVRALEGLGLAHLIASAPAGAVKP